MAARKPKAAVDDAPAAPPAFYLALSDLMIGHPASGVMPVPAFRAGDRVPADLVEANEWAAQVAHPDTPGVPLAVPAGPETDPDAALAADEETDAASAAGKDDELWLHAVPQLTSRSGLATPTSLTWAPRSLRTW